MFSSVRFHLRIGHTEVKMQRKETHDGRWDKTRIITGTVPFSRWKELQRAKDFKRDTEVICFPIER